MRVTGLLNMHLRFFYPVFWTLIGAFFILITFFFFFCGAYLQMADWLYAGPSAALSAWPT